MSISENISENDFSSDDNLKRPYLQHSSNEMRTTLIEPESEQSVEQ